MNKIVTADDNSFISEILQSSTPVLVDFSASWCAPCHRLSSILEEFSKTSELKIVKVDVDDAPEMSVKYGIRGVPTLMLFKDGINVDTKIGFISLVELNNFVSKIAL